MRLAWPRLPRISATEGYYEATVDSSVVFSEDDTTADLMVDVEPGPRVQVVFAGDPLPENRRETLVPIRQERSVDLDLLEDACRNIEGFLRQQGYRTAQALLHPRAARHRAGADVHRPSWPAPRPGSAEVLGNEALADADLASLLQLQAGEPLVDSRVATVAAAIAELYRVRGFARASVKPEIAVEPPRIENGQERRGVVVRFVITEGLATTVGAGHGAGYGGSVRGADSRASGADDRPAVLPPAARDRSRRDRAALSQRRISRGACRRPRRRSSTMGGRSTCGG